MENPYLDIFLENFHLEEGSYSWTYKLEKERVVGSIENNSKAYKGYLESVTKPFALRDELTKKYAWAIPTEEAINLIQVHSPNGVVEIGAGTGYWCWLLKQKGVKVFPYDIKPLRNDYIKGCWTPISRGGASSARKFSNQTLLLCWPVYKDSQAAQSLRYYRGDTFIYIGEGAGGCTGDDEFHTLIRQEENIQWEEVEELTIPRWPGMHDYLTIYRRR